MTQLRIQSRSHALVTGPYSPVRVTCLLLLGVIALAVLGLLDGIQHVSHGHCRASCTAGQIARCIDHASHLHVWHPDEHVSIPHIVKGEHDIEEQRPQSLAGYGMLGCI